MLENPRQIGKAQGGALRDATVESTPLLSITALALDFIAVLHTGTTVASRIAANTRVLPHARRSCGTVVSRNHTTCAALISGSPSWSSETLAYRPINS